VVIHGTLRARLTASSSSEEPDDAVSEDVSLPDMVSCCVRCATTQALRAGNGVSAACPCHASHAALCVPRPGPG
jgi:hypothetical protein